jgi:hypothetical protein
MTDLNEEGFDRNMPKSVSGPLKLFKFIPASYVSPSRYQWIIVVSKTPTNHQVLC